MNKLKNLAKSFKSRLRYYRRIYSHPKTPKWAKILLWAALGYAAMPFDLIPDFIPVIGHLDDVIIIPALVYFALKIVPDEVKEECKEGN